MYANRLRHLVRLEQMRDVGCKFGPNDLDNTFGPEVRYVKAPAAGQVNLPPSAGMQFFGEVQIDGHSAAMTVHLRDLQGQSLWSTTLQPQRA